MVIAFSCEYRIVAVIRNRLQTAAAIVVDSKYGQLQRSGAVVLWLRRDPCSRSGLLQPAHLNIINSEVKILFCLRTNCSTTVPPEAFRSRKARRCMTPPSAKTSPLGELPVVADRPIVDYRALCLAALQLVLISDQRLYVQQCGTCSGPLHVDCAVMRHCGPLAISCSSHRFLYQ